MLVNLGDEIPFGMVRQLLEPESVVALQAKIHEVFVSEPVLHYLVTLVQATRDHPLLRVGASPRASRALYKATKAWAAMHGRTYVTPDDVQKLAAPVLSHRLTLTSEARLTENRATLVLQELLATVPVPPTKEAMLHAQ